MSRFLLPTLFFFLFASSLEGQRFSGAQIEKSRERYDKYEQCLNERRIERIGSQAMEAIAVRQGASIKLECFECTCFSIFENFLFRSQTDLTSFFFNLHPAQQEIIEDVWKPNDNFIGRKIQTSFYNIKQKFRHQLDINVQKPNISWEFMPLQKNAKWTPVMDLQEPSTIFRKFAKIIKNFASTSSRKIGRWFELEIPNANVTHAGWYRCVQRTNESINISSLYFVEVVSTVDRTKMRQHEQSRGDDEKILQQLANGLTVFEKPTKWTACNKCGANETGHQFRRVACRLKINPAKKLQDKRFEFLKLFGNIPCQSSLIPLDIRTTFTDYSDAYEFKDCQDLCPLSVNETRKIERLSNTGQKEIVDGLPPGEYSIHERLPPLQARVRRHVINKIEDDPLVLDCGETGNRAILWHRDFRELNASTLLAKDSGDRIYMTNEGQLVFRQLELEDHGLYSCFVPPYRLVRTFRLYVAESDRSAELISLVEMSIRFVAVLLLVILVITVVVGTDSRTEGRRASNS